MCLGLRQSPVAMNCGVIRLLVSPQQPQVSRSSQNQAERAAPTISGCASVFAWGSAYHFVVQGMKLRVFRVAEVGHYCARRCRLSSRVQYVIHLVCAVCAADPVTGTRVVFLREVLSPRKLLLVVIGNVPSVPGQLPT